MTRALLLLLLSACAGAPTYRQATPVARPWTTTTTYTLPPGQPYTPVGAGAAVERHPSQKPTVERSPNKRALPDEFDPKKQPGLWTADEVRASNAPPAPITRAEMEAVPEGMSGRTWKFCVADLNAFLDSQYEMKTQPLRARLCIFSSLLDYCVWRRGSPELPHPDPQDPGIYDSEAALAEMKSRQRMACGEDFGTAANHPLYGIQEAMRQKYKARASGPYP